MKAKRNLTGWTALDQEELLLYLASVRLYLEFCATFWATQCKREIDNLEGAQKMYFCKSRKLEAKEVAWTIPYLEIDSRFI